MKFQNPSFIFFLNGRTHTRTHGRTDGRTSRKQYAPHFFKVGGIIKYKEGLFNVLGKQYMLLLYIHLML